MVGPILLVVLIWWNRKQLTKLRERRKKFDHKIRRHTSDSYFPRH